ncbi:uncharacterized protein LOC136043633 [Artemia franciscana]|uniref:uncharacterized protein LOC136043633 n=1 Tax=Artemia franciscana TaxID=6661 RepID=UPI0032DB462D
MEKQSGLQSYLRRVYGDNVTKEVFKYISTNKRHTNIINQQDFLHQCKKKRILPPSIKFNLHLGTFKGRKFERGLQFKTLNHLIKDKRALLVKDYFCFIQQTARNHFNHDFHLSGERLLKKFSKLSENKAVIPSSSLGPGFINFSSRTLTLQKKSVLEKGPKFCFRTNKVPVEEIISSIETSLHRNPILIKDVSLLRASTVKTLSEFALKQEIPNNSIKDIKILNNLRRDESNIITKADKGKTLVVMATKDYDSKLNALQKDEKTHQRLSFDPTDSYTKKFKNELKSLKDERKITP